MIVYCVQNLVNGKKYVGYSTHYNSSEEFQKSDYWGSGLLIKKAIEKYGKTNFKRWILIKDIFDFNELNRYEILWIKKLKVKTPNGYNLTDGGSGCLHPTEEAKQKRKKAFLKTIDSFSEERWKEIKEKIIKGNKGKIKCHRGRPFTEEHKNSLRVPHTLTIEGLKNRIKSCTDFEVKKKMKISSKKSLEKRMADTSNWNKHKEILSEAQKKRYTNIDERKKTSELTKKSWEKRRFNNRLNKLPFELYTSLNKEVLQNG